MIIILCIISLFLVWVCLHLIFRSRPLDTQQVIAHRGDLETAPENSMEAVQSALVRDADIIEIDVRLSKDNVVVLMHDPTIDRTTHATGDVSELTWTQLKKVKLRSTTDGTAQATMLLPRLDDVLAEIVDKNGKVIIEVKDPAQYPNIASILHEVIVSTGAEQSVTIASFDNEWIDRFSSQYQLPVGYITVFHFKKFDMQHVDFLDIYWANVLLDPTLVYRAHRHRQKLYVWTVDNRFMMRMMKFLGVDGVTTNKITIWYE